AYRIELWGGGGVGLDLRFTDGALTVGPPDSRSVDCLISADPVAFLLVGLGRVTQWQAIACGLLSAGGERPELAFGFLDLFRFP
ncbi:MAG: SCP2 sterol-binding domain-containing protein, partial [Acidimicrobiia bacterium]